MKPDPHRKKKVTFATAALLFFTVPLATIELYPFSIFPMYCYNVDVFQFYSFWDPNGRPIPAGYFDLDLSTSRASSFHRHRGRMGESLNVIGGKLDTEEVGRHVREVIEGKAIPFVTVEIVTFERQEDGVSRTTELLRVLND